MPLTSWLYISWQCSSGWLHVTKVIELMAKQVRSQCSFDRKQEYPLFASKEEGLEFIDGTVMFFLKKRI
jgi:hypothetical protein